MLYLSTRNLVDSYTAYRVLREDYASNDGLFVPLRLNRFADEQISGFREMSFGQTVAYVLNYFFSTGLTQWDIDFAVGRRPLKLHPMNHRLYVAELWRNHNGRYSFLEQAIYTKVSGKYRKPTDWAKIAIRIAVLFAVYGELWRCGIRTFDVAVDCGKMRDVIVLLYAKKLGFPAQKVICCCDENSGIWDLIQRGICSPNCGAVPESAVGSSNFNVIERLIYEVKGREAVSDYLDKRSKGLTYCIPAGVNDPFEGFLFPSVISHNRALPLAGSIYKTNDYLADPYVAAAYGGLQDYRAHADEGRTALLLSDYSPLCFADMMARATGLTVEQMKKKL